MKKLLFILMLAISVPASAKLRVVTTYPYIADITRHLAGPAATVEALAPAAWDPHFVVPRPSLIASVRNADLLIMNGAELEIGWLPPVIRDAKNSLVQPGREGLLDLSQYITKIEINDSVSRSGGDVHPSGNPHFALDPYNVPIMADAITERLCLIDRANAVAYRASCAAYKAAWQKNLVRWQAAMAPAKGKKVIQYHRLYNYFLLRYGLTAAAEIEPLPGIPPTSTHMRKLMDLAKSEKVSLIMTDVYHSQDPARMLSEKTGVPFIVVPHDTGSLNGSATMEELFDTIVRSIGR
jgi:zinc/manganese transport system substrate-binding protein